MGITRRRTARTTPPKCHR